VDTRPASLPLNQIYFYLTRGCNLRCRHCWITPEDRGDETSRPVLDFDLLTSILQQGLDLGLSCVKLTGGEPLMHPRIHRVLERIRDLSVKLTVETNAVLCSTEIAALMKACKDPFVAVSLDGADAETHEWMRGVKGSFKATLQGIRNLVAAGLRPQIIMSLVRRNKDQVEALIRMAESLGAASVKFNLVQPTARGERMHQEGMTVPLEELVKLGRWVETELSSSSHIPLFYSHPPAFRPLGRLLAFDSDGCRTCGIFGIIGVLADGSYALCGIGETVPELVFGDSATRPLKEVWHYSPVLQEIRQGLPYRLTGVCADCLMKGLCLGECVAQNYYRSKSLWSSFWYCQEAYDLGLFPETRLA